MILKVVGELVFVFPAQVGGELLDAVIGGEQQIPDILQTLLITYWGGTGSQTAVVVSRIVNGSLITLGEHPMFIRRSLGLEDDAELSEEVIAEIREYTLNSIRAYRPAESNVQTHSGACCVSSCCCPDQSRR